LDDGVRLLDPAPAHLADVQETVNAAEIDKCAEVAYRADDARANLPLGQLLPEFLAGFFALLLQQSATADDEIALGGIDLGHQAAQPLVDELLRLLHTIKIDLADRHEAADTVDIDGEATFVGARDAGFDDHADGNGRQV